jgi:hypothetical protein
LVVEAWLGAQSQHGGYSKDITPLGQPLPPPYGHQREAAFLPTGEGRSRSPRIAGGIAMTDAQRQLYQALKTYTSDLKIERGSPFSYGLDNRIEATQHVLEWLGQALEQPEAMLHQDVNLLPGPPARPRAAGEKLRRVGRPANLDQEELGSIRALIHGQIRNRQVTTP